MNPAIDPKQLEVLIGSDVFKQAQATADAKRIAAHRAAVDALLTHEADTTALEAARAAVDEARRKLEPVEAAYRKARIELAERESHLQSLAWSREHLAGRLRHEAARHLPEIVVATRVTGRTSDYGLEADPGQESKLPVSLSVFAHKPAEKAIRSAIQKAVADIIRMTPPEYFRN